MPSAEWKCRKAGPSKPFDCLHSDRGNSICSWRSNLVTRLARLAQTNLFVYDWLPQPAWRSMETPATSPAASLVRRPKGALGWRFGSGRTVTLTGTAPPSSSTEFVFSLGFSTIFPNKTIIRTPHTTDNNLPIPLRVSGTIPAVPQGARVNIVHARGLCAGRGS